MMFFRLRACSNSEETLTSSTAARLIFRLAPPSTSKEFTGMSMRSTSRMTFPLGSVNPWVMMYSSALYFIFDIALFSSHFVVFHKNCWLIDQAEILCALYDLGEK